MNKSALFLALNIGLITSFLSCISGNAEKKLFYEGVLFKYPQSWTVETNELPGESYSIKGKEGNNIIFITFTEKSTDLKEVIETHQKNVDRTKFEYSAEKIIPSKFGKYDALSSKFMIVRDSKKSYGNTFALKAGNKSYLIIMQSDTEDNLNKSFETIKNSFEIKTKP